MRNGERLDRLFTIVLVALCGAPAALAGHGNDASDWQPLFNGRDLTGWYTFIAGTGRDKDPDQLIQVRDGVIHAYRNAEDGSEQPIGYFCTKEEFSNYRLRFQYKWGNKRFAPRAETIRDAGLLYHVTGPDGRWGGVWPLSVECQVQENDTGDLITVDTRCITHIDPATEGKEGEYPVYMPASEGGKKITNTWYVSANKVCDRLEGWNDVEVQVRGGDMAVHIVNGEENHRLSNMEQPTDDGWAPLTKGRIAFQIESAEVMYRNIKILPLGDDDESDEEASSRGESDAATTSDVGLMNVPEGFEVELVAAPPLVHYPMMACLDDRGRLFIAESDGINRESVVDILKDRPHKILMLEDTDGDGRFDKSSVFAEGLVQANGAEWHDDALYVCSAPYLWRFRDTDGDGRADEQVRVVGTFNFDGMSSAFHGPVFGPDGRMYLSGGQHGWRLEPMLSQPSAEVSAGAGGPDAKLGGPWTRTAPGAFSSWPDGSDPRNIGHGGIANPVETAFTEAGEVIGTIALLDYVENQRRDAIVHWIEGGLYYMKDFNYAGLVRTGDDLVPLNFPGHVAPSGIMRYRGQNFGSEYRNNYFFAEFNSHKVSRLILERDGASFRGRDEDFLTSANPDSHFTDVLEDADGSLLVLDTGGWFLHGCPTSQIAKPNIYGGVYRVRRTGGTTTDDPRGLQLEWENVDDSRLISRFDDRRFAVRGRAVHTLAERGASAVPALIDALRSQSAGTRLLSVWALNRIDSATARDAIRSVVNDDDGNVCLAAIHCVGLHDDRAATQQLIELLGRPDSAVRRKAAGVLGQFRAAEAVSALLSAAEPGGDRFLEHAVTLALVRTGNDSEIANHLASNSVTARRLALIALDQLESPLLTRQVVVDALNSPNSQLHSTALKILEKRAEWSEEIVGRLNQWLGEEAPSAERQVAIRGIVGAFWQDVEVQQSVAAALRGSHHDMDVKLVLLDTIGQIDGAALPDPWATAVKEILEGGQPVLLAQGIDVALKHDLANCDAALENIALDDQYPAELRIRAAAGLVRRQGRVSDDLLSALLDLFSREIDSVDRLAGAQAIGSAALTPTQLHRLVEFLPTAGPLELPGLLRAFEHKPNAEIGFRLVDALSSMNETELPQKQLAGLLQKKPSEVRDRAASLLERFSADAAPDASRLQLIEKDLHAGDAHAGRAIFFGDRAACSKCHRVGDEGGQVGPNLSQIGAIRSPRDLAEAVLYPSASFVREFESYVIITSNGKVVDGLLSRQTQQAVYIRLADLTEVRVDRGDIQDMRQSDVSIMPQGLEKTLSDTELRDLVAFLRSLK